MNSKYLLDIQVSKINQRLEEYQGLKECKICFDPTKIVDNIIIPCGHLFCCTDCVNNVRKISNECPKCRTPIQSTIKVVFN